MSDAPNLAPDPDMQDEYDFTNGIQGKYAQRYAQGSNVVVLAPDVAAVFVTSQAVNEALRTLIMVARQTVAQVATRPE